MKKQLFTFITILVVGMTFAQSGFNYKALITDNGNVLNNQTVTFRFSLLQNGTANVYQETQSATTDANGIVSVNVGEGTALSGDFSTIDWGSNSYFLKVEIDTGSGFQDFGTSELKYVPYAKYAETAGNTFSGNFNDLTNVPAGLSDGDDVNDADHDPANELQTISKSGSTVTLSNGGGSFTDAVNDADHSTTNELQTLSVNGTQLTISNGNTVTLPIGNSGDQWGTQVVQSDTSLNGDGTTANPLAVNTNSTAFNGWDKNASDDFSGDYNDLTNAPDVFEVEGGTDVATSLYQDIYHIGNIRIGYPFSSLNTALASLSVNRSLSASSTDDAYGIINSVRSFGTGKVYGAFSSISGDGSGDHFANYNRLSGDETGHQYCVKNYITNTENGIHMGVSNILSGNGSGPHFGVENQLFGSGTGLQYGTYNKVINTSADSWHYGTFNFLKYGGAKAGTYNSVVADDDGLTIGTRNSLGGDGNGEHICVSNIIIGNGNGPHYGIKNIIPATDTGTGNKYGTYSLIADSSPGKHYAVYGEATKDAPDVYAGYFVGDVNVKSGNLNVETKITAPDSGDADMKAYIYGKVSGNGFVSSDASSSGFTVSRLSDGVYEITFSTPMNGTYSYTPVVSISYGYGIGFIRTQYIDTTHMKVYTYDKDGNPQNHYFTFVIYKK